MTRITLTVTGAQAWAAVDGPLTSGMVGLPVTIEYDGAWEGLTKNLVCRSSPWESDSGELRTILDVGTSATVAPEVMRSGMYLHLGIEGFSADGQLVIPTTWASCGEIQYGANTGEDPSTDPSLPVWNQLQTEIEKIKRSPVAEEQLQEIQAYTKSASQAADDAASASTQAHNYVKMAQAAADLSQSYAENAHANATSAVNLANGALQAQRAAEAAAARAEAAADSLQDPTQGGGLTTAQANALEGVLRLAKYESDPAGAFAAFYEAFGITAKVLESISAVYTGGEVAVGTALTELDGIAVTATYSDGSAEVVVGYTLTGEIAEGSNTITVSYGGKTATITVVGVAAGDEPAEPLYGRFWPPMGSVQDWSNPTWDDVENFAYTSNVDGSASDYVKADLPGGMFIRLDKLQGAVYIRTLANTQYGMLTSYANYSVWANSDGEIATGGFQQVTPTVYRQFGGKSQTMEVNGETYYFVMYKFEIPVGQTGYFLSTGFGMSNGVFISSDKTGIDDEYKPYYTLFGFDPSDRITEPATEVA